VEHGFDETVDVHAVDELRRNVQGYEPVDAGPRGNVEFRRV
jgi:hypothetical protein